MCLVEQAFSVIAEAFVTVEYIWHTMSFCSDWLAAQRATVSSMISQKWEMQLKCQVAASSYYDDWKEMCAVADAGADTAAELNLWREEHTLVLEDLTVFIPYWGWGSPVIQSIQKVNCKV